jgi:chromosome segregation ATPase
MTDLFNNAGFVALAGTIFGGAGLKLVESWLGRAKERANEAASIREELRKEIDNLRSQLEKADAEEQRLEGLIEEWRSKYYDLRDEKQQVVTELTILKERLLAYEKSIGLAKPDSGVAKPPTT